MTTATIESVEDSVAKMVGAAYTGATTAPVEPEAEVEKFEFDEQFQTTIATLALRDTEFMRQASHLLKPEYFESAGEAGVVELVLRYFERFKRVPEPTVFPTLIRDAVTNARMKKDTAGEVVRVFKQIKDGSVADREYVAEKVAEFARHQAVGQAILSSVSLLEKKKFDPILKAIKEAYDVGLNEADDGYDYWSMIEARTEERLDEVSGKTPPKGISTGLTKLDDLLMHKGFGRKELTLLMGGAKAGKSTALINFAKNASLQGKNVLYVTLELAADVIAKRLDASISENLIKELLKNIHDTASKIKAVRARSGLLKVHEFPSSKFTPNSMQALIDSYKAKGVIFDLVVVDYLDIMAPNYRTQDSVENSKSIYTDMRAIALVEGFAMLSATQTNREGFKSTVAKAEHVAEDFNRIRIADLVISINITDEERSKNEARLYFAASRNQESGFTVFIQQDMATMTFIKNILRVE
ncbi:DnaB-like helicase C-terminal domain-containing protein [Paraburkholderia sp.]|uniref:DnaB-like helicase C-terminal domain-containing protein n=1 Tax=Paraburkholderia sp. TaxID=1926495 RepID=UPI0039E2F259